MGEGRIIWVSPDGDDSNNGLSRTDAVNSLSVALNICRAEDEIFLAEANGSISA